MIRILGTWVLGIGLVRILVSPIVVLMGLLDVIRLRILRRMRWWRWRRRILVCRLVAVKEELALDGLLQYPSMHLKDPEVTLNAACQAEGEE